MRYHLIKASRLYFGLPYCGPSSDNLPAEADTIEEAIQLVKKLNKRNPVGWMIVDSYIGEEVQHKTEGELTSCN